MKIESIFKNVLLTGLCLLALTCVILLATDNTLSEYQYCFVFGTMCMSVLIGMLFIKKV